MKLVIERTSDGSDTLRHPVTGDTYHSARGAVGESQHVFIENGLAAVWKNIRGKAVATGTANLTTAKCTIDEAGTLDTKSVVAGMTSVGADGIAITDICQAGEILMDGAIGADCVKREISILEIGFGSGLNAWLSLKYALANGLSIDYTGIELYPVGMETVMELNYAADPLYVKLHESPWEESCEITERFTLTKRRIDFTKAVFLKHGSKETDFCTDNLKKTDPTETVYTKDNFADVIFGRTFDLVYFDAFAPAVQPKIWAPEQFAKLYGAMNQGGILVTYSAAGAVKRALAQAGFRIERLAGALGKRHMSRAMKE